MRFCSACGGSIVVRRPEGDELERFVCAACGTIHYVNPKVVVGAVCVHDDRVLLCRRAIEPRAGFWTIPAGFMEMGDTAEQGAVREALEEARAVIAIDGLIAVYTVPRIGQVQILYRAHLARPKIAPGAESLEVALVAWDVVPWDDLAFPTVRWVLRRARELRGVDEFSAEGNPEPLPDMAPVGA